MFKTARIEIVNFTHLEFSKFYCVWISTSLTSIRVYKGASFRVNDVTTHAIFACMQYTLFRPSFHLNSTAAETTRDS